MYGLCFLSRLVVNIVNRIIFCFVYFLVSQDGQFTYIIGKQDTARWDPGVPGAVNPTITYTYQEKTTVVELLCDQGMADDLTAIGEGPQNLYRFQLKGKCSCWDGCKGELF